VLNESPSSLSPAGDGDAFREFVESYRRELLFHRYRILGSLLG
jgi:hypothetical protein